MVQESAANTAAKPTEGQTTPEPVSATPEKKLDPPEGAAVAQGAVEIEKPSIADALLETPEAPPTEKSQEPEPVYPVYNDPDADSVVSMLRKAKISVAEAEQIFAPAAAEGDLAKIPLAALEARVGKEEAALVLSAAKSYWARKTAELKQREAELHTLAGGPAEWASIVSWAQSKAQSDAAFANELNEYRGLLNSSHASARLAVKDLAARYKAEKGGVVRMVEGDNAGTAGEAPQKLGLTRAEYARELGRLESQGKREEASLLRARWRKEHNK